MLSSASLTIVEVPAERLLVHEIYASIQGESSFAGLPCAFVRLSGCNLRCRWCDTPQAFTGGERMTVAAVLQAALALGTPLVELTGGEPLLQPSSLPLLRQLCDAGRTVLLETSGERCIAAVDPRVHRIVDFKAPGSGEVTRNRWQNVAHLGPRDEVKFVLTCRQDYEWARARIAEHRLHERVRHVLLSCAWDHLPADHLVAWMLEDRLPARFQLQMHKYIWSPEAQGV
ncbi:MAG: radical SAM protein [Polyangiales bacterium]